MTRHDPFLRLAASAMDFPLSTSERARLSGHLEACAPCSTAVGLMRSDAAAIASIRVRPLTERRSAELLDGALHPPTMAHPARLLAVMALLGLLLAGTLLAGSQLLREQPRLVVDLVSPPVSSPIAEDPAPSLPPAVAAGWVALTRSDAAGRTWIEAIDLESGDTRRLGDGGHPAWMGNRQLAFACSGVGGTFDGLCYARLTDAEPSTIVMGADQPAAAPDGRRVVMHRGTIDVGETWLVGADGNELTKVADGAFLLWAPDGRTLLGQPEGADARVATIAPDGTGLRVLDSGYDPAWSPDGALVAYVVVADGSSQLRVVNVATGDVETRLTVASPREISAPVWLSGGRLVVVLDGDLWRIDAGPSAPVRLTTGLDVRSDEVSGPPVVAPDGSFIAFTTGEGAGARVRIASVDGGPGIIEVATGAATQPAWAPTPVTLGAPGGELGDAWTEAAVPAPGDGPYEWFQAVTVGGPGFVAVGSVIWTSADGRTWMRVPSQDATDVGSLTTLSGPTVGMVDVASGTPGIVAIGYAARPDLRPAVWFSTDGNAWVRTTLAGDLDHRVSAVTWDGRQFVIVGEDRDRATSAAAIRTATARAAVWTSTDGRTWAAVADPALAAGGLIDTLEDPASGGAADVAAGPIGVVAVGATCVSSPAGCSAAAWRSDDGRAWQRAEAPPVAGRLTSVASFPGGYLASGMQACTAAARTPTGCPALLLFSPDGRAWTRVDLPQAGDLGQVATVGSRVFLVAPDGPVRLWTSADGRAWAPASVQGGTSPTEPGIDARTWRFASSDRAAVWLAPSGSWPECSAWFAVSTAD